MTVSWQGLQSSESWGNRALSIIMYLLTLGAKYVRVSSHMWHQLCRGNTIAKSNQSHKITII